MNCQYCDKEKAIKIQWEGLKGYFIGKKCLKENRSFFIEKKLKNNFLKT